MTNSSKLGERAFDLITCDMPALKRFHVVIIGTGLVSENKSLPWDTHRLIKEIIGPLE